MSKYSATKSAKSFVATHLPQLNDKHHAKIVEHLAKLLVDAHNTGYNTAHEEIKLKSSVKESKMKTTQLRSLNEAVRKVQLNEFRLKNGEPDMEGGPPEISDMYPHAVHYFSGSLTGDKSQVHMFDGPKDHPVLQNPDTQKMIHNQRQHLKTLQGAIEKHHPNWSAEDAYKEGKKVYDGYSVHHNQQYGNKPNPNSVTDQKIIAKKLGHHDDLQKEHDNVRKNCWW